jgi:ABC-2 type transport system ATP-binding protein
VVGLMMARYVVGSEPLASAPREAIVHAIGPTIQRYITGDPSGRSQSRDPGRGRVDTLSGGRSLSGLPTEPPAMTATIDGLALATRGLQKKYGSRVALTGLDLSVPAGIVYGFLGPNGAGKTTTMRLLTGLIHPDAGTIELLGAPFGRRDRRRLFDVGALIESPSFYPYLSARENLRALAATGAPTTPTRIEELLELVGLRERARDKVGNYSLGMKQRLGIAAALLSDPKLLLLDEPANGLDPAGIVAMRETLRHLASTGKTVFVSSHNLGEVQQLADIIGIIAAGRLVREGPIEQLLQDEGVVRVQVALDEVERAMAALRKLVPDEAVSRGSPEEGWLSVKIEPNRAGEVNRTLALAGIFASGLEAGSDLEALFLQLTGGERSTSTEGTFFGAAGAPVPPGWGSPGDKNDGGGAS